MASLFRVFTAGVIRSSMSGKGILFNSPQPYVAVGRAAFLFLPFEYFGQLKCPPETPER